MPQLDGRIMMETLYLNQGVQKKWREYRIQRIEEFFGYISENVDGFTITEVGKELNITFYSLSNRKKLKFKCFLSQTELRIKLNKAFC